MVRKVWRAIIVLVLVPGSGLACAASQPVSELDPEVEAYVGSALDSLEAVALTRGQVDWAAVRSEAFRRAAGAPSTPAAYPALRYALDALGDNHSFLQLSDSLAAAERAALGIAAQSEEVAGRANRRSPYNARMAPEARLIERDGRSFAFVFMPQGRRNDSFAEQFQAEVGRLAASPACGWVVDLRGNGGGNMWPMLAGLGPILGEGRHGSSTGAEGETEYAWVYRGGQAIAIMADGAENVLSRVVKPVAPIPASTPVAVLTDRGTGSSGEVMAVSFRGRPNARSFGETTAAASTSTRGIRLSDGANMVVATAVLNDATGVPYPSGIRPDVEIAIGEEMAPAGRDPVVAAATDWLVGQDACLERNQ